MVAPYLETQILTAIEELRKNEQQLVDIQSDIYDEVWDSVLRYHSEIFTCIQVYVLDPYTGRADWRPLTRDVETMDDKSIYRISNSYEPFIEDWVKWCIPREWAALVLSRRKSYLEATAPIAHLVTTEDLDDAMNNIFDWDSTPEGAVIWRRLLETVQAILAQGLDAIVDIWDKLPELPIEMCYSISINTRYVNGVERKLTCEDVMVAKVALEDTGCVVDVIPIIGEKA